MANICWMKRDVDNQARELDTTNGLLRCHKVSWTLVHKRFKPGPEFLPTVIISFCPSPSHYVELTWRPTASLNKTALGSSAAQIWSPKNVNLEMLSRRAALTCSELMNSQVIAFKSTYKSPLHAAGQCCLTDSSNNESARTHQFIITVEGTLNFSISRRNGYIQY